MKKLFLSLLLGTSVLFLGLIPHSPVLAAGDDSLEFLSDVEGEEMSTFDDFLLTSWVAFYNTEILSYEEQLQDLARSGMNWVVNPAFFNNGNFFDSNMSGKLSEYNTLYDKYNMYFTAVGPNIESLVLETTLGNIDRSIGYYVKDEPSAAQFESTTEAFLNYLSLDPDRFPFASLFPNYAGAANLGGSYYEYVSNWVKTVGAENLEYLSFDHYPFTAYEAVRSTYFSDLETIRKVAYENGRIKTLGCTQLGSWNGMRRPTFAECRWDVNSLLAYGMKGLIHFNWVGPTYVAPQNGGEGMLDFVLTADGQKTELYEPMQVLNWQVRQLGDVLMKIDVAHAYQTGTIATGTEALPKNFLLQPESSTDNLIFSLGYTADDQEKYVMIFSKELEETKTYTINVDLTSGIESMTWYKPDDFDTLPDYMADLDAPEEIAIDVATGKFRLTLEPGEMRIYKLNGDVKIKEALIPPVFSLKSGTYIGEQTLELTSAADGVEIYYTTDGSYPTIYSHRYTGPISIGSGTDFSIHQYQAIAVRQSEISSASSAEYIISDASVNVAYQKTPTFTCKTTAFQGSGSVSSVTNGSFDPYNVLGSPYGTTGWAIVDFGKEYTINKVIVKAFHDWAFADVVVQIATDANFTENVYTVYSNDSDNSLGLGAGKSESYVENPSVGHIFKFAPKTARYIRFTNTCVQNSTRFSAWEEIQAFTAYSSGTDLIADTSHWTVTGGGTWVNSNGTISQTDPENKITWDRSFTYTGDTFKNFVLDATLKIKASEAGAWGYVGFGLYKPEITNVQSDYDQGYYVAIEPKGRVLVWNGAKPELGPADSNINGFSINAEVTIKIVTINNVISVSVNNKPVMVLTLDTLDREAGYISIHSGLLPCDVTSLSITELPNAPEFKIMEQKIYTVDESKVAVERFVKKDEVISGLPSQVSVSDIKGNNYLLPVIWNSETYDRTKVGSFEFSGTFTDLPLGLVNADHLTATMTVFIKPDLDTSYLEALIQTARSLRASDFSSASWTQMINKVAAAEDMLSDPFLVQSDLGVGSFQLFDALNALVSTVDKNELIAETNDEVNLQDYTEYSALVYSQAMTDALSVINDKFASDADVDLALQNLHSAKLKLKTKIVPSAEVETPTFNEPTTVNQTLFVLLGVGIGTIVSAIGIAVAILLRKRN